VNIGFLLTNFIQVWIFYGLKTIKIKKMVKILEPTPVLVGAGIHQAKDVEVSLKMGARGILVASDVVKAEDPRKELLELAEVFRV